MTKHDDLTDIDNNDIDDSGDVIKIHDSAIASWKIAKKTLEFKAELTNQMIDLLELVELNKEINVRNILEEIKITSEDYPDLLIFD